MARNWTDEQLKIMERRIAKIYSEAKNDIVKSWNDYMHNANNEISSLQDEYNQAKNSGDTQYMNSVHKKLQQAKKQATIYNKKYKDMIDDTTYRISHTNQIAIDYMNGKLPSIYTVNYNDAAKTASNIGVRFDLVSEDVVKRMIVNDDIRLPRKKINIPKDKRWNTRQLNSAVLQGILSGESMDDIAKRIEPIIGGNRKAAIRNARTMVTGAENAGKNDSFKRLEELGAIIEKTWLATSDRRTRHSHRLMNGETIKANEIFSNGLEYPGDPDGEPEEVYNCRCTMVSEVIGVRRSDGSIKYI